MTKQELGILGENKACVFLKSIGHKIINRNYRLRHEEVDIISTFEGLMHFTEVKTRQTAAIGEPWRAVTITKQKSIIRVADHYLKSNLLDIEAQFNIVSIVHNQFRSDLEYIPKAFVP